MRYARLAFLLTVALSASVLSAAPITLHNTGVNSSDVVLGIGSTTSFWTLSGEPAGATETLGSNPIRYFNGAYYADNSLSGWVSGVDGGFVSASGVYTFQLLVDLTGLNPATAIIAGTFGTDNDGAILLNGSTVATTCFGCFGSATAFTMSSGFVAGINVISVQVDNGGNPTAFRVQFSQGTADPIGQIGVPEPAAFFLSGAGLALAWMFRRRALRLA